MRFSHFVFKTFFPNADRKEKFLHCKISYSVSAQTTIKIQSLLEKKLASVEKLQKKSQYECWATCESNIFRDTEPSLKKFKGSIAQPCRLLERNEGLTQKETAPG